MSCATRTGRRASWLASRVLLATLPRQRSCRSARAYRRCGHAPVDSIDWGEITLNRLRQWAAIVRRLSAQALRRYGPEKRATLLLAFLLVRCEEVTNIIVEMFDLLVGRVFDKSDAEVANTKAQRAQLLQESARHLRRLYEILVDETIPNDTVRDALFRYLPRERWEAQNTRYDAFERGEVTALFSLLGRRFGHLRSFTPTVLQTLHLSSSREEHPLLAALQTLAGLEGKSGRAAQIPAEAPFAFVPSKWRQAVQQPEGVQRQAWEMTLLHEVRGALRSGDLTVAGSRRYAPWDTDLYSPAEWSARRAAWYDETGLPEDGAVYLERLREELHTLTYAVSGRIARQQTTLRLEHDRLHIEALERVEPPPEAQRMRAALLNTLPHPCLPDLLMEVDSWAHFTDAFLHLGARRAPSAEQARELRPALFAALLAEGTNLGLATMARSAGFKEHQLQRVGDWYLREETVREAITRLMQYQHSLSLAGHFGDGTTSSSDGVRFGVAATALHGRHQPRYFGVKRGVTLISHVSDQGSQFWVDVVNCQMRESTYVLDGLLYQDTFPIKEHYTDTGGYSELIFGCFELLGYRFAPRIKDLPDQALYRMQRHGGQVAGHATYGSLDPALRRTIREPLILAHWDEVNRLAASLRDGRATPSVVIAKLQATQRQNPVRNV